MIGYSDVVRDFKKGVTFYEDVYGNRYEMLCVSDPVVTEEGSNLKVTWEAINYGGGIQEYLITKGLEHYGPKLYWSSGA